jgi:circadian clock protein KaiB
MEKTWNLKLYVNGLTGKSSEAIANLKKICLTHLGGRCHIEVIDLKDHPDIAARDNIFVTPTLIRELPEPVRKIIGDLSQTEKVLVGMEISTGERS